MLRSAVPRLVLASIEDVFAGAKKIQDSSVSLKGLSQMLNGKSMQRLDISTVRTG